MRRCPPIFFALPLICACSMGGRAWAQEAELHPGHPAVFTQMARELHEEQWNKTQQLRAALKKVDMLSKQVDGLSKRVEALEGGRGRSEAPTPKAPAKSSVKPKKKPQK